MDDACYSEKTPATTSRGAHVEGFKFPATTGTHFNGKKMLIIAGGQKSSPIRDFQGRFGYEPINRGLGSPCKGLADTTDKVLKDGD